MSDDATVPSAPRSHSSASDVSDMRHAKPGIPREVVRSMVLKHGGRFHGPKVEHLLIEEEAFHRLVQEIADYSRRCVPAGND